MTNGYESKELPQKNALLKEWGPATRALHIGSEITSPEGSVMPGVELSTTFSQSLPGNPVHFDYARGSQPNVDRLERCLASLEQAEYALCTSSGMSAIALLMELYPPGSKILCSDDVYGGTYRLFQNVLQDKFTVEYFDFCDGPALQKKLEDFGPQIIWSESLSNPLMKIPHFDTLFSWAQKHHQCDLIIDNTFTTPLNFNPLGHGAKYVVHSLTKFINGHSDVIGGAIMMNNQESYERLCYLKNAIGPSLSPWSSWLCLRGVKTLAVRLREQEKTAQLIAQKLQDHPEVDHVYYPGNSSHLNYQQGIKYFKGAGSMMSFTLKGSYQENVLPFLKKLHVITLAESLGGVESLINHPARMTHASIPAKQREAMGITDNLLRLSVGLEEVSDLLKDLQLPF